MQAFESLIAMLLRRDGYWTATGVKVDLEKSDKRIINRSTSPRWEIDVVAYSGARNELLAVECKSFLDSTGVIFVNGSFYKETTYKLFTDAQLREVVLRRLTTQLVDTGACAKGVKASLCLAAGKIASRTDRDALRSHFEDHKWQLFDEGWITARLENLKGTSFENDVAYVVAKLLLRRKKSSELLQ